MPCTPKSVVRRQSLVTTALLNSARKAIESAKKTVTARSRLSSAGTPQKAGSDDVATPRKRSESATDETPLDNENGDSESETGGKV